MTVIDQSNTYTFYEKGLSNNVNLNLTGEWRKLLNLKMDNFT
jgi:hypothetical protein